MMRIQEKPPSEYDGSPNEAAIWLHLEDGKVLEVIGSGDDCDDYISHTWLSRTALRAREAKRRGYEAKEAQKAEDRRKWLALTCEERQSKLAEQEKDSLIQLGWGFAMMESIMAPYRSSFLDEPERTIKIPCRQCHETECENATTKVIPAKEGLGNLPWTISYGA